MHFQGASISGGEENRDGRNEVRVQARIYCANLDGSMELPRPWSIS